MNDLTRVALTFPSSLYKRDYQESQGRAAGATTVVHVGADDFHKTWRNLFAGDSGRIRAGDHVWFLFLALVPVPRGKDKLSPTSQLSAFLAHLHDVGALGIEIMTGRTTKARKDREAMIADAERNIRAGGPRRPPKGVTKPGRRPKVWPNGKLRAQARNIWRSAKFATNEEAASEIAAEVEGFVGFQAHHGHKLFAGSGRPRGPRSQ